MKQLGGLTLPEQLEWSDKRQSQQVAQSVKITLGGTPIIYAQQLSARDITLQANEGVCWLTQAQADAILAMAAVPGASYELTWDSESWTVVFRHHDGQAVDLSPIWPHFDQFVGTIKLMSI